MKRNRKSLPMFQRNLLFLLVLLFPVSPVCGAILIDHNNTDITAIPQNWIETAKQSLHIAYGHTSHGSQLTSGMTGLVGFANGGGLGLALPQDIFKWNNDGTGGALDLHDLAMGGDAGDYPRWFDNTVDYLGTPNQNTGRGTIHPDVNVIIWSWCGEASGRTEATMLSTYLTPMSQLETNYPGITFVYMTGHSDGSGEGGNLHARNQQIRNFAIQNNKVLYDFYDIELYDPDGNYYGDKAVNDNCNYDSDGNGSRDSNWATNWQNSHTQNTDWYSCTCAHSKALNCNRKAYAVWNLFARIAGWPGVGADTDPPVRTEGNPSGMLPAGTTQATLSIHTDENATCKYATGQNTDYDGMPNIFSGAGSTSHSALITGLQDGTDYTYYVRCRDGAGNENDNDFTISFRAGGIIAMEPVLHLILKDN